MKALYKYPHAAFPYELLRSENAERTRHDPEFELTDTGIFDEGRYFDVELEYAKASPEDILIRITVWNRGPDSALLHLLPTWWFRNTWSWGRTDEQPTQKPTLRRVEDAQLIAQHESLGNFHIEADVVTAGRLPAWLFTENETNTSRIDDPSNLRSSCKDAFHLAVVEGRETALNQDPTGTKAAAHYRCNIPSGSSIQIRLRMSATGACADKLFGAEFENTFKQRIAEADAYFASHSAPGMSTDERRVVRQANAGLLWTKQFYHYVVPKWLEGGHGPAQRDSARNQHAATDSVNRGTDSAVDGGCAVRPCHRTLARFPSADGVVPQLPQ